MEIYDSTKNRKARSHSIGDLAQHLPARGTVLHGIAATNLLAFRGRADRLDAGETDAPASSVRSTPYSWSPPSQITSTPAIGAQFFF